MLALASGSRASILIDLARDQGFHTVQRLTHMGCFLVTKAAATTIEWRLQPGNNRIGRNPDNDLQLSDPSISGHHCEILNQSNELIIRDLGSTNGTFIDTIQIQEAALQPGQTVKLGNVELVLEDKPELAQVSVLRPVRSTPAARTAARPASKGGETPDAPRERSKTFFQALPAVFSYPFRKRGPLLLVTGTIFFLLLDFASMTARFAPLLGLIALLFLTILGGGFLFSFMQGIITSSAGGEDEMPGWPDISDFWQDLIQPFFRFAAIWAVCFLPGVAVVGAWPPLGITLLLLGVFCLPMALLAVSMADSVSGLNPLIIFPSIMKVPGAYLIACLMLLVIIGIETLSSWILDLSPIPMVPTIAGKLISLYVLILEMRVLGLLYRFNQHRLRWL